MKKNKAFQLLGTFPRRELSSIASFLAQNHPNRKDLPALLNYLKPYHPGFNSPKLEYETIFAKVYGKNTLFRRQKLLRLMSDFSLALEKYILWKRMDEMPFIKQLVLLRHLLDSGEKELFLRMWQDTMQRYSEGKDLDHFYQMILNELRFFEEIRPESNKKTKQAALLLREASQQLDYFYVKNKLRLISEAMNRAKIFGEQPDEPLFELIIKRITPFLDDETIRIRFLLYQLFKKPSDAHFIQLKDAFFKGYKTLPEKEQFAMFTYLLNYISGKIKSDLDRENLTQWFTLFDFGAQNNFLMENGIISSTKFNNAINVACNLGKVFWAEVFRDKFAPYLPEPDKEATLLIAQAQIDFHRGYFSRVIEQLKSHKWTSIHDNLRVRTFLLKSYFHLHADPDDLLTYIYNFEMYVRRKKGKVSENVYDIHLNFILFARRLVTIEFRNAESLRKKIINLEFCASKGWLLRMIDKKNKGTKSPLAY
ncbi:MAG: hypothetical protein D6714_08985 [Bacteroidetes bacterium]|nr:MAG: hypothetical protein D6714_08985 [Bacteroidota bacterium]